MAHVAIIGNEASSLLNFRGDLIRAVVSSGYRITAMSDPASTEQIQKIEALGAQFRSYPVQRNGLNPLRDLQTFLALRKSLNELKPDVVLAYTIKPVIWSGIAAYLTNVPKFYALIEGLGYAFQNGALSRKLTGILAAILYHISLRKADKVIFLNQDNKKFFLKNNIIPSKKAVLIDGIGLDLNRYTQHPFTEGHPVFLCIARLLGEKGLREYAQAAQIVKQHYPKAIFRLLGAPDPSPDGIPLTEIQEWQGKGLVEYSGVTNDVRPYLSDSHIFVLPSFYGEGLPRSILEAMAIGRPILTTDNVGCKETVVQGENGFLVPVRDAEALAERMIWFIEHRDQWQRMGQASRRMAEERFDVHTINAQLLSILFGQDSKQAQS
ncbi:N, N'-diacetylbacillosaminyl-diphospho-undecaprenol alpha-1,3-N-acetylgalactosaminyltransferase [Candidatus Electronema halotolerans]